MGFNNFFDSYSIFHELSRHSRSYHHSFFGIKSSFSLSFSLKFVSFNCEDEKFSNTKFDFNSCGSVQWRVSIWVLYFCVSKLMKVMKAYFIVILSKKVSVPVTLFECKISYVLKIPEPLPKRNVSYKRALSFIKIESLNIKIKKFKISAIYFLKSFVLFIFFFGKTQSWQQRHFVPGMSLHVCRFQRHVYMRDIKN